MATCKECIHEKLCVIKAFPDAFENTQWEKEPCDHFKCADVVPKKEIANVLSNLKHKIHDKAVRPNNAGIDAYISLKVFDAILQNFLKRLEEKNYEN